MKQIIFHLVITSFLILNLQVLAQNMALSVDGVDDYLEVFDSPSLDLTGPLTICVWYYFNPQTIPEPGLIQKDGPASWGRYGIWLWEMDKVDFCLYPVSGYQQCLTTESVLTPNQWNHIAAVYNGTIMEVFVGGSSKGTLPSSSAISTSDSSLYIGSDVTDGQYIKGYIDEVSIWSVARTQAQIQLTMYDTLSSAYYSTSDSGLVAYYRFDQYEDLGVRSDGSDDIRDFSVNANHGDSEGSPLLVSSTALTEVENMFDNTPGEFSLFQNYPNPFNPNTSIKYAVGSMQYVSLKVYDVLGKEVAALVNEEKPAGTYNVEFTINNLQLSSGVYFYQLKAGLFVDTKKMILLR
jgi:hypothetical protein